MTLEPPVERAPLRGHLKRTTDESGVSGEGVVAEFALFTGGRTVISWYNDANENLDTAGNGLAVYDTYEDAVAVHGHEGATEFIFTHEATSPWTGGDPERRPNALPDREADE